MPCLSLLQRNNKKTNEALWWYFLSLCSYCSTCVGVIETTQRRGCSELTLTSFENFLDFDMVGTEAAVELKVVGVVQKGSAQWGKQFLNLQNSRGQYKKHEKPNLEKLFYIKVCACVPDQGFAHWVTLSCSTVWSVMKSGDELVFSSSVCRNTLWKSSISGRLPNRDSI